MIKGFVQRELTWVEKDSMKEIHSDMGAGYYSYMLKGHLLAKPTTFCPIEPKI